MMIMVMIMVPHLFFLNSEKDPFAGNEREKILQREEERAMKIVNGWEGSAGFSTYFMPRALIVLSME